MDIKTENMLDYLLSHHKDDQVVWFKDFYPKYTVHANISEADCSSIIKILHDNEMIDYITSTGQKGRKITYAFRLSYKAQNLEEFEGIESNNFFKENWISILALLVSIIALFKP